MNDREVFEGIKTATVLKPGDRVLLTVQDNWTREMVDHAKGLLHERLPDVEFTIASGVESVAVLRDPKLIEEETDE